MADLYRALVFGRLRNPHSERTLPAGYLRYLRECAFVSTAGTDVWASFVMPRITDFALLLAAFELAVGILLLSHGRAVKIALTASLLFNLFLVQLGLGYPAAPGSLDDFVHNRLANVLFILIQTPLYCIRFDKSLPALIRAQFR